MPTRATQSRISQSHSSLKSYTEYWFPGWLARRVDDDEDELEEPARDGLRGVPLLEGACGGGGGGGCCCCECGG